MTPFAGEDTKGLSNAIVEAECNGFCLPKRFSASSSTPGGRGEGRRLSVMQPTMQQVGLLGCWGGGFEAEGTGSSGLISCSSEAWTSERIRLRVVEGCQQCCRAAAGQKPVLMPA